MSGEISKDLQKIATRRNTAHVANNRLDNDAGNLVPPFVKFFCKSGGIVEWEHRSEFGKAGGHARTIRQSQSGHSGSSLDEKAVAVTMVAAVEFDDAFASREAAGQADRAQCRFGAGIHEAHLLDRRNDSCDQFGDLDFSFGRRRCAS